ncbi:DUF916 and DUF3324 domain-containing protein [Kurthia sibirica]|uniref:Cell wall anchor protein n=1 Tax=Kurthia sibirica TaxID=202750 RepID=A0A2U3ANQ3_9BACL|nr:DUF916 and DUF3324 domain-containing protein [Kurthia sibirica]PWI26173.1 cell wall anchor protein [Kurthia sibirica]GEK33433.1 cell wall surface anchor protein [Kurthia sibirica]
MSFFKKISVLFVSVLFFSATVAGLMSKSASAAELNFSVTSVLPDNQIDKKQSYFDLKMKPGQEQTVYVMLDNATDKKVTVMVSANEAKTNINGTTQYDKNKIERDSTLNYSLEDIVTVKNKVVIPPKKKVKLPVHLKMPDKEVKGIILGGLSFQQKESELDQAEKDSAKENGMSIKNRFSYNLAMSLKMTDDQVEPELVLNKVEAQSINARTVITANIQNTQPMLMNQLEVNAFITKKGESEKLFKKNMKEMQMAPNSNFNYQIPLNGEQLEAGTYTADVTAKSMGETWHWKKDFTISSDEAKQLNKADVDAKDDSINWTMWILIAVGIIIVLLLLLILVRQNKNKRRS